MAKFPFNTHTQISGEIGILRASHEQLILTFRNQPDQLLYNVHPDEIKKMLNANPQIWKIVPKRTRIWLEYGGKV